jgi:phosphopantothenoylcysteine synthetase/decarboxylase
MPYVVQLRSTPLEPVQIAGFILQARSSALQQGQDPPALQLILAEQLEVLVARLFPDEFANEERRAEIIAALREAMSAEGSIVEDDAEDADEDDDDDEGDDEDESDEEEIPAE